MKYAILIHEPKSDFDKREGPEAPEYWAGWQAYTEAIRESGVMTGGAALQPPETATTVRISDGVREVQDGPFADSKEQFGGFYLIDVDSLDEAVEWAARCPASATGSVEVRPVLEMDD